MSDDSGNVVPMTGETEGDNRRGREWLESKVEAFQALNDNIKDQQKAKRAIREEIANHHYLLGPLDIILKLAKLEEGDNVDLQKWRQDFNLYWELFLEQQGALALDGEGRDGEGDLEGDE